MHYIKVNYIIVIRLLYLVWLSLVLTILGSLMLPFQLWAFCVLHLNMYSNFWGIDDYILDNLGYWSLLCIVGLFCSDDTSFKTADEKGVNYSKYTRQGCISSNLCLLRH